MKEDDKTMNSTDRKKLAKSINIIERLLEQLDNDGTLCPLPHKDAFYHIFYEKGELDKFFVSLFPNEKLDKFGRVLSIITNASGSTGNTEITSFMGNIHVDSLKTTLNDMHGILSSSSSSDNFYNIFYSWESDLCPSTNRNLIEAALVKAIKKLKEEFGIPIKLDKDTREITGSPDIIRAILEKVDRCFMFVADVSIITRKLDKCFTNPNVMFELGYAINAIGDEKVIMIFNNATGSTKDLPFDLGLKRQMIFYCPDDITPDGKSEEKEKLANDLYNAIKLRIKNELSV